MSHSRPPEERPTSRRSPRPPARTEEDYFPWDQFGAFSCSVSIVALTMHEYLLQDFGVLRDLAIGVAVWTLLLGFPLWMWGLNRRWRLNSEGTVVPRWPGLRWVTITTAVLGLGGMFTLTLWDMFSTAIPHAMQVGDSAAQRNAGIPVVLSDTNSRFEITVPGGWQTPPGFVPAPETVYARDEYHDLSMLVSRVAKSDVTYASLKDVAEWRLQQEFPPATNPEVIAERRVQWMANPGLETTAQATANRIVFHYQFTFTETSTHFYEVQFWGLPSRMTEFEPELRAIAESLRVTSEQ